MEGRIRFDRKTLSAIFSQIGLGPGELSEKTGAKVRAIKNWRIGNCTMPAQFFEKLCLINPAIRKYERKGEGLGSYWGSVLGGKRRVGRFSREEIKEQMKKARGCKNTHFPDIGEIDISNPLALEFYGVVMGDGCVSRYYIKKERRYRAETRISGNSIKDKKYFYNFLVPTMRELFGVNIKPITRKDQNVIDLVSTASHVSNWLTKHRFPVGKKVNLQIPQHIMSMPAEKRNNVVRGLFDTDGCVAARKDEEYKYPYIFICSISKKLREQLKETLREQGLPAYIHGDTTVLRGGNNFKIWFKKIGSSNPRNIRKYNEWLSTGKIIPKGL